METPDVIFSAYTGEERVVQLDIAEKRVGGGVPVSGSGPVEGAAAGKGAGGYLKCS
jgi:hypothetical protein